MRNPISNSPLIAIFAMQKPALFIALFLSVFMLPCAAQEAVHLVCTGHIKTTIDGRTRFEPVTKLDVAINTISSTIEIDGGYWGCMADLYENDNFKCIGKQPVTITDSEFKFEARSANDGFEGNTNVKINRYSGSFSISSMAYAKPAAQALWRLTLISGRLECSRLKKSF